MWSLTTTNKPRGAQRSPEGTPGGSSERGLTRRIPSSLHLHGKEKQSTRVSPFALHLWLLQLLRRWSPQAGGVREEVDRWMDWSGPLRGEEEEEEEACRNRPAPALPSAAHAFRPADRPPRSPSRADGASLLQLGQRHAARRSLVLTLRRSVHRHAAAATGQLLEFAGEGNYFLFVFPYHLEAEQESSPISTSNRKARVVFLLAFFRYSSSSLMCGYF